jgi:O-antigen/teichoic acid export membrane protein
MSMSGQIVLVASLPVLTRLYSPADFGIFTIYLSLVNDIGSIAALRFEPSLYVVDGRPHAQVVFKLILLAILATSIGVLCTGLCVVRTLPDAMSTLILLLPIGIATAGLVEAMNCWSLRFGHLRDFALGRLVLPCSMAALQLAFGFAQKGGNGMVAAHILSQCVVIAFLAQRVFTRDDVRGIAAASLRAVAATARREYKFPLFDLPATAVGYAIINLPAVLIGSLFGTGLAGHFGVAARLVTGPVTLIAAPLSNVLVAEASKGPHDDHLRRSGHGLLLVAVIALALPTLGLAFVAPHVVVPLLGEEWRVTGQIIAALAVMAAVQAISTPLQEVPTLMRRQEIRLVVDAVRALLVFTPLLIGFHAGWAPLTVIYAMAAGGTAGFVLRAVVSLLLLNRMSASAGASTCAATARDDAARC